jgi:hypothetical protein
MPPVDRSGQVNCQPAGDRWTAVVQLEQRGGTDDRQYAVSLNRSFATEAAARRAGEELLAGWRAGRLVLRDILLRELAGTYRTLRETYKPMQPSTVPATRAAWERAIATWEQLRWIDAEAAARCRDHARCAFDADGGPVRRHRLSAEADYDPTA